MDKVEEKEVSLMDTLHRCLMCDSEAFEYEKNKYKCSNICCEFTWKVMTLEGDDK